MFKQFLNIYLYPKNKLSLKQMPLSGFQLYIPPKDIDSINPHIYLHLIEYKEFGGSKYTSTLKYSTGLPVLDLEIEK